MFQLVACRNLAFFINARKGKPQFFPIEIASQRCPSGDSRISALDTVVIYGPLYRINELDTRCAGIEGNQAHAHACHEYDSYLEQVATEESAEPPEA